MVIIDQVGVLTATQHGSGSVSDPASNILILNGNSADLAAELASITLTESVAGPDTIDVETYGAKGPLSDNQISVFAATLGQSLEICRFDQHIAGLGIGLRRAQYGYVPNRCFCDDK